MLRALKYKLNRSVLEKIYFAFIRPIFEYGCVVWDKSPRHDILFNEMEKIQLQAARIVTGTNNYSSKHMLYIETGWDKLSKRREKHRLILLFKIINNMAPMHLLNTYNNFNNASCDYNLRNNKMQLIYTRTESFRSLFPQHRFDCGTNLNHLSEMQVHCQNLNLH